MKPRSHEVTDGMERAPARAMLRAIGMTDADWGKAQVGVASSWNEVTPCNMPLDRLAKRAKQGVRDAGGFPIEFVTIAVSDGISMGHEGMRGSLVSREIIADSVECVMHSERLDALVTFAGLRQEPARHADGRGPAQPAVRVPLRRLDPARSLQGPGARRRVGVRGGRRVRGRHDHRERARRDRTARVPDRRFVRGHVHREHDVVDRGGDRHGACRVPRRRPRSTAAATTSRTSRAARSCTCSSSTSGRARS